MNLLVAVLAFVVAFEYAVIAFDIVPRLAKVARIDHRISIAARWGATAFLAGCAVTHTMIGLQTLFPSLRGGMDMDMAASGSDTALLFEMVLPHIAQIVGGAVFIGISRTRLEVNITSKEEAAELREVDSQLRNVFDKTPLGIAFTTTAGRQTGPARYVNPAYVDILGYSGGDPALAGTDLLNLVHPADRASVESAIRGLHTGQAGDLEFRIVRPDGAVRWIHARRNPITDQEGVTTTQGMTILEDITERINAHAALVDSERRFVQLANSVGVGINLRQLRPPRFLFANPAYVRITGIDPTQPVSTARDPALVLIHPDDRDRVMAQYWVRAQAGEVVESEHQVLRPDGQIRWARVTSNPVLDEDGSFNRVAGTVEDITVRKDAEAVARAAQLAAERANLAKSEFLSRMSHELRTPLNAILGFGQLLELDPLKTEQAQAVGHILGAGRHLLTMIDEVLDISRIETDHLAIALEPVRLAQLLTDVVGLMHPAAAAGEVTLQLLPEPAGTTACVHADRRRLQQVVLNLLSNAIKYNTAGGSVQVSFDCVEPEQLSISIKDTGMGIRPEDIPRLFTPFDRLGQQKSGIEGTGIGLALTRRLVSAMSGDIRVESTFGAGSTFTVVMPRATC